MSLNTPFLFMLLIFVLFSKPPLSSAQLLQNQQTISSFSFSDSPWHPSQNKILSSPNSIFAAGFLPLPKNPNLFNFSIWYQNVSHQAVIWSANPKSPVNRSASLIITSSGQLILINSSSLTSNTGSNLWPQNTSENSNTTKLLLNNFGNLIFGNWESFTFPTDTILANQSIRNIQLVSDNGKFRFINSSSLVFLNSSNMYWKANSALINLDSIGKIELDVGSIFCSDLGLNRSRKLTLDNDGNLRVYSLDSISKKWIVAWEAIYQLCLIKGICGSNSICVGDGSISFHCECPPGFRPSSVNGDLENHGCTRKISLTDMQKTKFIRLDYVNFPDDSTNQTSLIFAVKNFSQCESQCFSESKCLGFMFKYSGKGECRLQLRNLLYGVWSPASETALFLRVDRSEIDETNFKGMSELLQTTCPVNISLPLPPNESDTTTRNIVIICTLFAAELISGVLCFSAFLKRYMRYRDIAQTLGLELLPIGGPKRFTYAELKAATNGFSNLIGKGGFGDVYKGELSDHRVVAVKCLKNVTGGDAEFWAEVTIIARMHHLNLVRLWGFCAEKGQRMLVYEYVRNGSLDKYLFCTGQVGSETERKPILDWSIRYRIGLGVARAIAYLHEECLEWVLHCDIKPENILLGDDFCPKLSDFGLAKLRKKEDRVSMSYMRGTRGYMAPEWAKMESITSKADVYSFGMVLLELVSGVRNNVVQESRVESENWYFPQWAFDKVFKEVNVEDILDPQIKNLYDNRAHFDMVNRMVKTTMWCLQSRPEMRPSMGKVAKMLEGTVEIIEPNKPTIFYLEED